MEKVLRKKVLPALLIFCLCLTFVPAKQVHAQTTITFTAAEGLKFQANDHGSYFDGFQVVTVDDTSRSGISICDENGAELTLKTVEITQNSAQNNRYEAVVTVDETLSSYKLQLQTTNFKFVYGGQKVDTANALDAASHSGAFQLEIDDSGSGGPGGPGKPVKVFDLHFYGVSKEGRQIDIDPWANVDVGNTVLEVPEDFDFDNFWIEVLAIKTYMRAEGQPDVYVLEKSHIYADDQPENNFRTGAMVDMDNGRERDAFSFNGVTKGDRVMQFGLEFHADHPANTYDYPGFYIMQMTLIKPGYVGAGIIQDKEPDMYDFATFNKVDLTVTSEESPGEITAYYGNDKLTLVSDLPDYAITGIEAYDLPEGAVTIDEVERTVKINSPFFDRIPLKVTSAKASGESVTGYMVINIIGIEARFMGIGNTHSYHGASGWGPDFPAEYQGKSNWVCTFYQDADVADDTYEMVALLTYADGSTETVQVASYGSGMCHDSSLKGCDYILWSGDDESAAPVKVSITAVKAGSMMGSTFNGCSFGSGAGVTVTK